MSAGDRLLTDALSGLLKGAMPGMRERTEFLTGLVVDQVVQSIGAPGAIEVLQQQIRRLQADQWKGPNNR